MEVRVASGGWTERALEHTVNVCLIISRFQVSAAGGCLLPNINIKAGPGRAKCKEAEGKVTSCIRRDSM